MKYITKIKEGQTTEDVSTFISQIKTDYKIIYESVIDTMCMEEISLALPETKDAIYNIFSPYGMLYFEDNFKNIGLLDKFNNSGKFDFITVDASVDFNYRRRVKKHFEVGKEEYPVLDIMGYNLDTFKAFDEKHIKKPIIAVADTGIDFNNRFLRDSLWVNENYDNSFGFNFTESNNWDCFNTYDDLRSQPERGHGTKITSIISSSAFNEVPGVFPSAKILTLKIFPKAERFFSQLVKALIFAALRGAVVINCSFEIPELKNNAKLRDIFEDVLKFLKDKKCIPVFAAPNCAYSIKNIYPLNSKNVITVSSVDWNKQIPRQTAWGKDVDIWAVGKKIKCFTPESEKAIYDIGGTSLATPFVVATVAMLKTIRPELDIDAVKTILTESGTDIEIKKYPNKVKLLNIRGALKYITN